MGFLYTASEIANWYSQICNYEIVTTDVPFAIDRNGEYPERTPMGVRKTTPPPYSKGHVGA